MDEDITRNIAFNFDKNKIDLERLNNALKQVGLFEIFKNKLYEPLGENGIKYLVDKSKSCYSPSSL